MNLKKKVARIRAETRYLVDVPARWETTFAPVVFLALLIPLVVARLAAAQDKPGAGSALVIEVYSGAVGSGAIQERESFTRTLRGYREAKNQPAPGFQK